MPEAGKVPRTARRLLLWPLAAWGAMAAVGYLPTRSLVGRRGIEPMIAAQAVVVAIGYVTLVPVMRRMARADAPDRLRLALKATAVRLIVTLPVVLITAWLGKWDPAIFLVWVAVAYLVMIKVQAMALVYWNKRLENQR